MRDFSTIPEAVACCVLRVERAPNTQHVTRNTLAVGCFIADRKRVRGIALTDNVPVMSAWSNDTHYERVFVEQLITHYRPGDTLVAISGSGNSPNVLHAVEWANRQGAPTIGLSGFDGGKLATLARLALVVPNHSMPQVEDVHMALCHALAVNLAEMIKEQVC